MCPVQEWCTYALRVQTIEATVSVPCAGVVYICVHWVQTIKVTVSVSCAGVVYVCTESTDYRGYCQCALCRSGVYTYVCLRVQTIKVTVNVSYAGVVYVCTESAFPHKRLQQLAHSFSQKHSDLGLSPTQLSDNIFVEHTPTVVSHGA